MASSPPACWEQMASVGGGGQGLVFQLSSAAGYRLVVSNGLAAWHESLADRAILERCQELNPALEVGLAADLVAVLKEKLLCADTGQAAHLELEPRVAAPGQALTIDARATYENYVLRWRFRLEPAGPQLLFETVTLPMARALARAAAEQAWMLRQLKAKDLEISEYKHTGAALTRKALETEPFEVDMLETKVRLGSGEMLPAVPADVADLVASMDFKAVQKRASAAGEHAGSEEAPEAASPRKTGARSRHRLKWDVSKADLFYSDQELDRCPETSSESGQPAAQKRLVASKSRAVDKGKAIAKKLRKL